METLTAVLAILVAIAILFEVAQRIGVPYPTLFVLGGLGLALSEIELVPFRYSVEDALSTVTF